LLDIIKILMHTLITYSRKKIHTPETADAEELYVLAGAVVVSRAFNTVHMANILTKAVMLTKKTLHMVASIYVARGARPLDRMDPMAIR
jgi:hypothetical protein